MSFIRYNKAGISEAVESMAKFVEHMDTTLEDIERECQKLMDVWGGSASRAYENRKESWNESAVEIRETILKITDRLSAGNENMAEVDRMQGAKFDGQ